MEQPDDTRMLKIDTAYFESVEPRPRPSDIVSDEPRASIFTAEQETELRRLKACLPYRIVWGAVNVQTSPHTFEMHASYDQRKLKAYLRKGWLVATVG